MSDQPTLEMVGEGLAELNADPRPSLGVAVDGDFKAHASEAAGVPADPRLATTHGTQCRQGRKSSVADPFALALCRTLVVRRTLTEDNGRLLAYVTTRSPIAGRPRNLALEQLKAGWARRYVYRKRFDRYSAFTRAQTSARAARRGAWGTCAGNFHSNQ